MNDYITLATAATLELVERVLLRSFVLTHLRPDTPPLKDNNQTEKLALSTPLSLRLAVLARLESSSAIRHVIVASFVP